MAVTSTCYIDADEELSSEIAWFQQTCYPQKNWNFCDKQSSLALKLQHSLQTSVLLVH